MAEQAQDGVGRRERARVDASDVSWAVRELQRAQTELDRALAQRMNLRALDYTALTYLLEAPTPLGPVELAHQLGISSGSGTELADRLERAGHLRRSRAREDRRRVTLEPDETSVEQMLGELGPLLRELENVAATFSPDEQAVVARYLAAVAERTHAHAEFLTPRARYGAGPST